MAYTREHLRMSGVLLGNGQTANCTVSAVKVTLEGTKLSMNCGYSIEWISRPLPEGDYKLSVDDKTIDMHYSKDGWRATEV